LKIPPPHLGGYIHKMSPTIPARIIQTGKSRELPLMAQAAVANLKCLNPGFEYLFFDDSAVTSFIQKEFPEHVSVFESFPHKIQRFDFFRYLAVYRLGGFYFDLDVFLAAGLEELLKHTCVFPFEELTTNQYLRRNCNVDWEIGNYAFAAAPGHPFLKAVIENCVRARREPGWVRPMLQGIPRFFRQDYEVLNTTGPGLLTRTLAENPDLAGDVTVLFSADVCDRATWHQFGNFGVHAMEGSWRGGSLLHRRLRNLWESRVARKGLEASRRLGKTRNLKST
jgi:hypothetical protein